MVVIILVPWAFMLMTGTDDVGLKGEEVRVGDDDDDDDDD